MNNIAELRHDFPLLTRAVGDQPLIYLDSGATSQKPQCVIDEINDFYSKNNSNVHRGLHSLSESATSKYEQVRDKLAKYLAVSSQEIVWTSGATESLNIIASGITQSLSSNDIILISALEHHANIVPWQQAAQLSGASIHIMPIDKYGVLDLPNALDMITRLKPAVVACTHASNTLGNITDIKRIIGTANQVNATTVIDGTQALMHLRPNLSELKCDFYVGSAHKALGPTGLGFLFGKYDKLNALPVFKTGGEMIDTVSFSKTTYRNAPAKFEPGTPNISGVLGFGAALDYLNAIDIARLKEYEQTLFKYCLSQLQEIPGIIIYGDMQYNIGTISFNYREEHHYDIATLLNSYGVALRSGHHCTQPLISELGIQGTLRVSLAFYNSHADIDTFITALKNSIELIEG
ncbi:cysteine desulfurase / selenocysteine lyase [Pseudoalteromonas citrea]|uniref:Cysteine desulfurase n=2 Tax=Pseudoalteromonas citrea TaxID=43655 RepID=A0AAD4AHD5_9GAMM|nr:SufS family cysteine desulfurase [Pseudoalteromonas citrea]KAF7769767.1 cysteine desulfurase / selenocysteine lyase [Pseudoalteromonas citrea]